MRVNVSAKDYKELKVYQLAFDAAVEIFEISKTFPQGERYSLTDQIRRSSRSVCANIAEAWRKRRYEAAFVSKLSDAETEAAETEVWLDFALKCGYIRDAVHQKLRDKYDHICRQLCTIMKDASSWCQFFSSYHAARSSLIADRSAGASADAPRSTLHAQRAFSLVEVTLAMMVMALGILTIMSLFPAGLDQNERSIADTHAAFFAEEIFAGMHAVAEADWDNLANIELPVAARDAMWPGMITNIQVTGTNVETFKYKYDDYEDHALRYRLYLTTNGLLKTAELSVWPGEFGALQDPAVFYAEFFRWKPVP